MPKHKFRHNSEFKQSNMFLSTSSCRRII
uniref:Uncharacterized protein n=1 Tax=Arundo donax TaxID=35708 RepID=A0A0A9H7Z0_ARUDO